VLVTGARDHRSIVNTSDLHRRRGPAERPVAKTYGVGERIRQELPGGEVLKLVLETAGQRSRVVPDLAVAGNPDAAPLALRSVLNRFGPDGILREKVRRADHADAGRAVIERIQRLGVAAGIVGHHRKNGDSERILGQSGRHRSEEVVPGLRCIRE
jgi:hypothetical protein